MGINRKTVGRYMQGMGIAAIYPGPNLSKRNQKEGVYPYLLRHITSAYPNHIWGIDITYIRVRRFGIDEIALEEQKVESSVAF